MSQDSHDRISILCFGECLWDVLPRGIFLGGAPLNVAYHLSRHGVRSVPVSAVGTDFLGDEAIRRINQWDVDARFVSRCTGVSTGTVSATFDRKGAARYRIAENAAWDRISLSGVLLRQPAPAAIVFGTLALRETLNRRALHRLATVWPLALRVLDLNLRAPFDRGEAITFALKQAQVVKLNDAELARMVPVSSPTAVQWERSARKFAERYAMKRVCVTAGAAGAGLLWDERWYWEEGRPTVVRDTIGAGDAFLAALLAALLGEHRSPARALASACRLGEFVASRDGATPSYVLDARRRPREQEE